MAYRYPTIEHAVFDRRVGFNMKPIDGLDDFTVHHLNEYIKECVWPHDTDAFRTWVYAEVLEDPTVVDLGWPSLYRTWMHVR